jgi:hypothetical protein
VESSGTGGVVVSLLAHDGLLEFRLEFEQSGAMLFHFVQAAIQLFGVDFQILDGLLADHQLVAEVETLLVFGGENDRRRPRTVNRIKAHDPGIRENADQHEIEHRDGKDPVERDDELVVQRLCGSSFGFRRWRTDLGFGRGRTNFGRANWWRCQRAPLVFR